jgi:hypothetical protein
MTPPPDDDALCPGCEWCGAAIVCMSALVGLGIIIGSLVAWVLQ